MQIKLDIASRISWLQLYRSESVGPSAFRELIRIYGSAQSALEALPDHLNRLGNKSKFRIYSRAEAERELEKIESNGAHLITMADSEYPFLLKHAPGSPPLITVLGNTELLSAQTIGVVGTRKASAVASAHCKKVTTELSDAGWVVVSGMALGIDTVAHKASLKGGTIAVLAGGVDNVYPQQNSGLYEDIIENGLIVSEMPWGEKPLAKHFPRRNRIIAGFAQALLVFEAAKRSGSLITARLANEFGREVWSAPGSAMDVRCGGTNSLIRDGANMLLDSDDVLSALSKNNWHQSSLFSLKEQDNFSAKSVASRTARAELPDDALANDEFGFSPEDSNTASISQEFIDNKTEIGSAADDMREKLLSLLSAVPVSVDQLIASCGGDAGAVRLVLLEAALGDKIIYHDGNRVSIKIDY